MVLLFYVIKIKQVLFSKLMCCVYQVNFFCMKRQKKALFQKDMIEKCCAVVKSYEWHMEKITYWENYYLKQPKILCHVFRNK